MKNNKSLTLFGGLVAILYLAAPAYGQKAWDKQPYTQWSLSDVFDILMKSPWAQRWEDETYSTEYTASIRLHSALPIRQALVRERQIYLNYHKFTAADKARFDSEVKAFLECSDCAKHYIVTVGSHAISPLRSLSVADLKPHVYLANDKGERRQLVSFVPPKEDKVGAIFVFQRFDEQGKPLVTLDNKSFYFKIDAKLLEKETVPLPRFTFEVSRLIQNGEIVF